MTQGTGQKDFVLDKCRFHLGDIRTKTWMVTGPSTSGLLGKVLQASTSNTLIVPISSKEYNSKKAQIQGKGKGRGKGKGGATRPEPTAEPMDLSDNEASALKFMKRKRGAE